MFMATNYTIMDILRSITTTKDEMKVSIGTNNDNITDFSYLIHNAKVDYYNNGLIYGYEKVWKDIYGNDVLIPGPYPTEIGGKVDVPGEEVEWDGTYEGLIDIMEIVLDARLAMKTELGTSSDVFATYPYTTQTILQERYEDGFDLGQDTGVQQVMIAPTIHSNGEQVVLTTPIPNSRIVYTIDDGIPIVYTGPITINNEFTITALTEAGPDWIYKSVDVSAYITLTPPDVPVIDVYMNVITITNPNIGGTIFYSFDNQTFVAYTGPITINEGQEGVIYAYCVRANLASEIVSAEFNYLYTISANEYLTITMTGGSGIISLRHKSGDSSKMNLCNVEVSKNNGEWTTLNLANGRFYNGDEYRFRSKTGYYDEKVLSISEYIFNIGTNGEEPLNNPQVRYTISGNIMSLLYNDVYSKTLKADETFSSLFSNIDRDGICTSAGNLVLPATKLSPDCYMNLLYGGGIFTSASDFPVLPATTLARRCYYGMFRALTTMTAPVDLSNYILPAMNLAEACYMYMFADNELQGIPNLPATNLAPSCYAWMFYSCNLNTLHGQPTTPNITLPATTLANGCYSFMFCNSTEIISSVVLPATILVPLCYEQMFKHSYSIRRIECAAVNVTPSDRYDYVNAPNDYTPNWLTQYYNLWNAFSGGIFVKSPDATWLVGSVKVGDEYIVHGIPNTWTIINSE